MLNDITLTILTTVITEHPIIPAMDPAFMLILLLTGLAAGILGSLFGIGGGMIIVPVLTVVCGLTAIEAAATSLVGIIATSVGGTVFYLDKGITNIRLGLLLEISTVIGAMIGALISAMLEEWVVLSVFTLVILFSAIRMIMNLNAKTETSEDGEFEYTDPKDGSIVRYDVKNKTLGFSLCSIAGVISSLTGVGGGLIKVPVMNMLMNVPMKAATATSSYMIGITAFSGAIIYFMNGQVTLDTAGFVAIGSFAGAVIGSRLSRLFDATSLKKYFSVLLLVISVVMIVRIGGMI